MGIMLHTIFIKFLILGNLAVIFAFSGYESENIGGEINETPYGQHCPVYDIGGATRFVSFLDGSQLAFRPLTNFDSTLLLNIYMSGSLYKVSVKGTMLSLERCHTSGTGCKLEQEGGVKTGPYITPYEWNEVTAVVDQDSKKISIEVGDREVMSMAINTIARGATWSVAMPETPGLKLNSMPVLYSVQFKCPELTPRVPWSLPVTTTPATTTTTPTTETTTTPGPNNYRTSTRAHVTTTTTSTTERPSHFSSPAPHIELTTSMPPMRRSDRVGLIVGIVIAALILVGLAICVYKIIKRKRQSMNVTEQSSLKKDKTDSKSSLKKDKTDSKSSSVKKDYTNQAMQE